MKYLHAHILASLVVREDLAIFGNLTGTITVAEGCSLFVNGTVSGNLVIERDSSVRIAGRLDGFVETNRGSLTVVGVITTPLEMIPGTLHVGSDSSVAVGGRSVMVKSDGALLPDREVAPSSLDGVIAMRWHPQDSSFSPDHMDRLKGLSEVIDHERHPRRA